jgi:ABC-type thiamine transport system ATPase subunit
VEARSGSAGSQATSSLAAALSLIERADVVFPAVHGPSGEDGTLAALCALTHKPMSGQTSREAEEITVTEPGACPVCICQQYAVLLTLQACAC